jgi:hypothetical protein
MIQSTEEVVKVSKQISCYLLCYGRNLLGEKERKKENQLPKQNAGTCFIPIAKIDLIVASLAYSFIFLDLTRTQTHLGKAIVLNIN